jgi:hypothetical protein
MSTVLPDGIQASPSSRVLTVEEHRRLTKRVLWKLDIHILPPLAFVRLLLHPVVCPQLLMGLNVAMARQFHRQN